MENNIKFDRDGTPMIVLDEPKPQFFKVGSRTYNKDIWERLWEWVKGNDL